MSNQDALFEFCLNQLDSEEDTTEDNDRFVKNWKASMCCFCGDECNELSQSCGRCARNIS